MNKIILGIFCFCLFGGYAFAQTRTLTQSDVDVFISVQPEFQKIMKKAVKDSQNSQNPECPVVPGKAEASSYRKQAEELLEPHGITAEEFGFIHSRVISLYALLESDEMMQQAEESLEKETADIPADLKSGIGAIMKAAFQKKDSALAAYTDEEISLIKKNKPQLDGLLADINSKNLSD
jgi:hypothetical protein